MKKVTGIKMSIDGDESKVIPVSQIYNAPQAYKALLVDAMTLAIETGATVTYHPVYDGEDN